MKLLGDRDTWKRTPSSIVAVVTRNVNRNVDYLLKSETHSTASHVKSSVKVVYRAADRVPVLNVLLGPIVLLSTSSNFNLSSPKHYT